MDNNIIRLVLKENSETNKDTKEGESHTYKSVLVGNIGEIEISLVMKTEKKELIDDLIMPKLREELYIKMVPNPQTTLDMEDKETPAKEDKGKKSKKKGTVINAKHRMITARNQKQIGSGEPEDILSQIA